MCVSHILSADVCEHVLSFSVELAAADSPRTSLRRNYYELFRGETLYYKPLVLSCAFCKCFRLNSLFLCVKNIVRFQRCFMDYDTSPKFSVIAMEFLFLGELFHKLLADLPCFPLFWHLVDLDVFISWELVENKVLPGYSFYVRSFFPSVRTPGAKPLSRKNVFLICKHNENHFYFLKIFFLCKTGENIYFFK